MFCENCGTRVEDGQPFCPNCGKRMGGPAPSNAAPAGSGFGASAPSRPVRPVSNSGGPLGKFSAMQGLEKIFYPIVGGLLFVCFILSMLEVYTYRETAFGMGLGPTWLYTISTIFFTLSLTFIVLDLFDKLSVSWLWIFVVAGASVIFIAFVIVWIAGVSLYGNVIEPKLTVGGWFYFLLQLGLVGCSITLLVAKSMRK